MTHTHASLRAHRALGFVKVLAAALFIIAATALADPVTGLTTFTAGTPARAGEVNANFTAVKTAVDNNHQRLATVEAQLASPQMQALLALTPYVSIGTVDGRPVIRITGANLQLRNGADSTYAINGTGNLILGYDENRSSSTPECSMGVNPMTDAVLDTEEACIAANGTWAINHKTGSHNLVIGDGHNYPSAGALVAGAQNTANAPGASVTGGISNRASDFEASVSGGSGNRAAGFASSVSGGAGNVAWGHRSAVSGGRNNRADGEHASVVGGHDNVSSGESSSVTGGQFNSAQAVSAHVSGGGNNVAGGRGSTVLGGLRRVVTTDWGTLPALP